jgi:hypothetical protein
MLKSYTLSCLLLFSFTLTTALADDDMVWNGVNGTSWSGFYTSPYFATDTTTGQSLTIFCLDYNHEIAPPTEWHADLNTLSPANQSAYLYGGSYPLINPATTFAFTGDGLGTVTTDAQRYLRYVEAAWLFTNLLDGQAVHDTNGMIISQVAAWHLFVDSGHIADLQGRTSGTGGSYQFTNYVGGGTTSPISFQQAVDNAIQAAQSAVVTSSWSPGLDWTVISTDPAWARSQGGLVAQEFLTHAPEPAAIVLFGTMLVAVGFSLRHRRQAKPIS